MDQTWFKRKY